MNRLIEIPFLLFCLAPVFGVVGIILIGSLGSGVGRRHLWSPPPWVGLTLTLMVVIPVGCMCAFRGIKALFF
jgi:hypothetical protein